MKTVHREGPYATLNIEPGEEVMACLMKYAEEHDIKAAHISGLGAAGTLDIAYYNLETKTYERTKIQENVEILSLNGNIGVKEDESTVVHLHGVFGKRDLTTFGGHLFELVVSGAGEIHLTTYSGAIRRAYDSTTGLTLMCDVDASA